MEAFPFPPFRLNHIRCFLYKWLTVDVAIYLYPKYACLDAYYTIGNFAFNFKNNGLSGEGFQNV
jgi:hypothetical protein